MKRKLINIGVGRPVESSHDLSSPQSSKGRALYVAAPPTSSHLLENNFLSFVSQDFQWFAIRLNKRPELPFFVIPGRKKQNKNDFAGEISVCLFKVNDTMIETKKDHLNFRDIYSHVGKIWGTGQRSNI